MVRSLRSQKSSIHQYHAPNAPWSRAGKSAEIPCNEIQAYFAGKEPLPSFDDILDGYPVEVL